MRSGSANEATWIDRDRRMDRVTAPNVMIVYPTHVRRGTEGGPCRLVYHARCQWLDHVAGEVCVPDGGLHLGVAREFSGHGKALAKGADLHRKLATPLHRGASPRGAAIPRPGAGGPYARRVAWSGGAGGGLWTRGQSRRQQEQSTLAVLPTIVQDSTKDPRHTVN